MQKALTWSPIDLDVKTMRSTMEGQVPPSAKTARRRVLEVSLGGGLFASFVLLVYSVLRYLIPPPVVGLGGDEVVASKVGDLKPNSSKIIRFGRRPAFPIASSLPNGNCTNSEQSGGIRSPAAEVDNLEVTFYNLSNKLTEF
jgi:hypothetical protein